MCLENFLGFPLDFYLGEPMNPKACNKLIYELKLYRAVLYTHQHIVGMPKKKKKSEITKLPRGRWQNVITIIL